jgi:aminoglycoside N3'-acetyltransferase
MRVYSLLALAALSASCGGGGGETTTPVTTPTTVTTPPSTKLADNPAPSSANFKQHTRKSLVIDASKYSFSADTVYAKVYINKSEVLFLGKISTQQRFEFHLPTNVSKIYFDLFSTVAEDPQITEEVSL